MSRLFAILSPIAWAATGEKARATYTSDYIQFEPIEQQDNAATGIIQGAIGSADAITPTSRPTCAASTH